MTLFCIIFCEQDEASLLLLLRVFEFNFHASVKYVRADLVSKLYYRVQKKKEENTPDIERIAGD